MGRGAATALACAAGLATGAEAERGDRLPVHALRADHMVLDAAVAGERLLVATQSGRLEAFDWRHGRSLGAWLALEPGEGGALPPAIVCVATDASGRVVAAAAADGRLHLLEVGPRGARTRNSIAVAGVLACRFLDDDGLLLGNQRGELALLDLAAQAPVPRVLHEAEDHITALAVDPLGRRIAAALGSGTIGLIDAADEPVGEWLAGHSAPAHALAFVDRGRRLLSAGHDSRVLIWDLEGERGERQP